MTIRNFKFYLMHKWFFIIVVFMASSSFLLYKGFFREVYKIGDKSPIFIYDAHDICITPSRELLISDKVGYRLLICDSTLKLKNYFGKKGKTLGSFKGPSQIAVNDNYIAVNDFASSRIQIFTAALVPIKEIYADGPVFDIAFDNKGGLLVGAYIVSENKLSMYQPPFEYSKTYKVKKIDGDMFKDIFKINILNNGNIILAYQVQNKIEILDSNGKYLSSFKIKDIQDKPNYKKLDDGLQLPTGILLGDLGSDSQSRIWVLAGHYSVAPKKEIFILSSEGILLKKVQLPNEAQKILIDRNYLYTIEDGGKIVKKYIYEFNINKK